MPKLKLWLVTWPDDCSENYPQWDYFDSLVVAAGSEEAARNFVPVNPKSYRSDHWTADPVCLAVRCVGEASDGIEPGMIIGSFNQA